MGQNSAQGTPAQLRAELDRTIPAETEFLTKVGLMNNNRQVAAEILNAQQTEGDPSKAHGYWDDPREAEDVLTTWPSVRAMIWQLEGMQELELILDAPPFQERIRDLAQALAQNGEPDSVALAREELVRELQADDTGMPAATVFEDPSVQAVMMSYAAAVTRAQGWAAPTTIGQAVIVWNAAIGLETGAWGPEWGQQMCSSASYLNAAPPHHRSVQL